MYDGVCIEPALRNRSRALDDTSPGCPAKRDDTPEMERLSFYCIDFFVLLSYCHTSPNHSRDSDPWVRIPNAPSPRGKSRSAT